MNTRTLSPTTPAPRFRITQSLLIAVILAALAGVPLVVTDSFTLHSIIMVLFFAYMATAWNFVCGYVGQLSLGHAMFNGMGGYVTVLLFTQIGLSPWLGMLFGGLLAAATAVLIGLPTFRLKGPYFTLTMIAFAEILRIWVENTNSFAGVPLKGAEGLIVPNRGTDFWAFQFEGKLPYYYIILGFLALALIATVVMERSKLGYCLKAIRGDRDAAEALGINPVKYTSTAFAISAFLTAMGGAFYGQFFRYINPERSMGLELSIDMAVMAIIGGQGSVLGPLLGASILTPIAEITRGELGGGLLGLHLVVYGIALMLCVLYFPKGVIHPLRAFFAKYF
jgi:branched-chain amino acid transport system permease protein